MKENKNRKGALERVSELFELPGEILAGMPCLTMTGNRRAYIEGHRGVLEYDNTLITVNCGAVILKIRGDKLEIVSMNAEELLITGFIYGFEFE